MAICLTLFYSVYWIFLKKETYFKLNRFYLIFSVAASLLIPLLNINTTNPIANDSLITTYLIKPVNQYEQGFSDNMNYNHRAHAKGFLPIKNEFNENNSETAEEGLSEMKMNSSQILPGERKSSEDTNWLSIVITVYFIGMSVFLVRFIANFILIFRYVLKYKSQRFTNLKIIKLDRKLAPFSFFNYIFLGNNEYPEVEYKKIIAHEQVHIQQKHSIDLIFFELLLIFQWFNPFVWFYKNSVKINHEYLADRGTLDSGIDLSSYQYSLLNQALLANNFEVVSSYNFSVKKRITMMMKKRSSKFSHMKLTITLPILAFLFSAFAFNCNTPAITTNQSPENLQAKRDSIIKKIAAPVDYLKLIEGEYVSTNEPGRTRRIVFTELFGELLAYDNGYTYRTAFVGEGKFINPDDKAELIFDTKDKNKISLSLFGKINLNKTTKGTANVANKSLAYTTANVILKDGLAKGLTFFNTAKDSATNYYFVEDEMNYAGYQFFERKKLKEAAAIFKLNTEKFPSSFNTYDSYAEALLALGEKGEATEQFKKSLLLNPGSQNGLKRLKELGVDPNSVVKLPTLKPEELQLLTGTYLSTNQPNFIRKIVISVSDDGLAGEDNGYKYKLIAMGEGKFINPDDGATLVFDTKDKNAISLLLFGKINLMKAKITTAPTLSLKEYAGIYIPSKNDTILKTMEILSSANKLFRFIENPNDYTANRNVELEFVTENLFFYPDKSGRSIEFVVNDKKEVTGCILRRPDGTYTLSKKK